MRFDDFTCATHEAIRGFVIIDSQLITRENLDTKSWFLFFSIWKKIPTFIIASSSECLATRMVNGGQNNCLIGTFQYNQQFIYKYVPKRPNLYHIALNVVISYVDCWNE